MVNASDSYHPKMQTRSPSKAASMFSGTQDKCATCGKTAYPLEKVHNVNYGEAISNDNFGRNFTSQWYKFFSQLLYMLLQHRFLFLSSSTNYSLILTRTDGKC